jgi:hypothetical protein
LRLRKGLSAVAFLTLAACGGTSMPPLDREAFDAGERLYKASLSRCEEYYLAYYAPTGQVFQFKSILTHGFNPNKHWKPSEADRLNGLEWTGRCRFQCSAYRIYNNAGGWSAWQNGRRFSSIYPGVDDIPLKKVKGEWVINEGKPMPLQLISCEQVPP